jgi:DNA-binding transcriptional regulator YiaG
VDYGFGIPVVLHNVRIVDWHGEEVPEIDYARVEQLLVNAMPYKPTRFTGDDIHFIRQTFTMTLDEFGKRFDVTGPAVKKWESKRQAPTGMNWSTEKDIRLFMARENAITPTKFQRLYESLMRAPEADLRRDCNIDADYKTAQYAV